MVQLKTVGERPSPRPAGRPRDTALDEAILAAALLQLGERGYDGMSLEGVAATAGTTVPSLRRRYRGKHQLTVAAIDSIRIQPPPPPRRPPPPRPRGAARPPGGALCGCVARGGPPRPPPAAPCRRTLRGR